MIDVVRFSQFYGIMNGSFDHNFNFFTQQISSLYAQVHGLTRIIFAGYFIRGHPVTMQTMSYAVKYFSKVRFFFHLMNKTAPNKSIVYPVSFDCFP